MLEMIQSTEMMTDTTHGYKQRRSFRQAASENSRQVVTAKNSMDNQTYLGRSLRRCKLPNLALEVLVIMAGLFEVGTERLDFGVTLGSIFLQPADHVHEIPFLAFCLLHALFQRVGLRG